MPSLLTDEWCALVAERGGSLAAVAGASMALQIEMTAAPDGKRRASLVWSDGQVVSCAPGRLGSPDCTVELTFADGNALLHGELDPDVAFMLGRLKIDGAYERWLFDLRSWRSGEAQRSFWSDIAGLTDAG